MIHAHHSVVFDKKVVAIVKGEGRIFGVNQKYAKNKPFLWGKLLLPIPKVIYDEDES